MANILWTPPDGWVEESGAHVSFKAPCDCSAAENLVIGSNSYSVVDAIGGKLTGTSGVFVSGAVLDFILDCENLKAYLQNPAMASYTVASGTSGNWSYIKKSDGTMICYANVSYSGKSTKAWGAWYYLDLGTFTYPIAFTASPTCIPFAVNGYGGSICFGGETNGTATKTPGIYITRPTAASNANGAISIVAIGKWK